MLTLRPYSPMQTYYYGNAVIHLLFLIFAYSKSINVSVLSAFCARQRHAGDVCSKLAHTQLHRRRKSDNTEVFRDTDLHHKPTTVNWFSIKVKKIPPDACKWESRIVLWSKQYSDLPMKMMLDTLLWGESHPILYATMKRGAEPIVPVFLSGPC